MGQRGLWAALAQSELLDLGAAAVRSARSVPLVNWAMLVVRVSTVLQVFVGLQDFGDRTVLMVRRAPRELLLQEQRRQSQDQQGLYRRRL